MKFRCTATNRVVELDPDYAAVFGDLFEEVHELTPLTGEEPCCGGEDNNDTESESDNG